MSPSHEASPASSSTDQFWVKLAAPAVSGSRSIFSFFFPFCLSMSPIVKSPECTPVSCHCKVACSNSTLSLMCGCKVGLRPVSLPQMLWRRITVTNAGISCGRRDEYLCCSLCCKTNGMLGWFEEIKALGSSEKYVSKAVLVCYFFIFFTCIFKRTVLGDLLMLTGA